MITMKRLMVGAALVQVGLMGSTFAQTGTSAIKKEDVQKQEASPFTGSFTFTVGSDDNIYPSKIGRSGSFYQVAPSLNYQGDMIRSSVSASIKDFSDQAISNNAKETSASVNVGVDTKILGSAESQTDLSLNYSDAKWPNYFGSDDADTFDGEGMPMRYVETKIAQKVSWGFDRLSLAAGGSFAFRDYASRYSDWAADIYGPVEYESDQNIISGDLRVGIRLSDAVEISATPMISHKKFDERPARETNGLKTGSMGGTPKTEFLTNQLTAAINIKTGPLTLTPSVTSGIQMDQATGAEDYSLTSAGLDLGLTVNEKYNVKLTGSASIANKAFDNWSIALKPGASKREDDVQNTKIGASVDFTKSIGLALAYENIKEESTLNDGDVNYRQEIFSTNLSIRF